MLTDLNTQIDILKTLVDKLTKNLDKNNKMRLTQEAFNEVVQKKYEYFIILPKLNIEVIKQ